MSFSFKKPEDSPGFLLWQLTNQWQRQQRSVLAKIGLTHPQFVVLAAVLWLTSNSDQSITQKKTAEFTKIDQMSMSDLVATLVNKKLLKRVEHEQDKRAYSLNLTNKGREKVLKAIPIVEGIDVLFFSPKTSNLIHLHRLLTDRL